ncbi:CDP-diacylglycerol--glycerol-3-phosphate 3-phosphatidyltransferase [Allopusillimonas ginsengisoli]|uniref:CDP-diacylglycerol--glycerol-3-phosphate 3-phosphatidyltransferase n=1 Tax=Allopusillimonas ginsengisoli TaxID=453575 RepID=UPI00102007F1|nr:CDP-diacylglycerol--glycerol-3-phosphate 3-phosphatidyltransferase [Allopusillimonas ginsengisoli]TEA77372.1 CDP-diacylglycerol--glycerol-3-phosphate 3-phosphatidyltransferase [Allopusillimonas ginsengisoli]
MPINLPIALTWLRIAMIPLVVGLFYIPGSWLSMPVRDAVAALAFIIAALTDWFDGWLARRWNQTSSFGAFLDPVADKLMVCAALLILLDLGRVDAFIALIIIGREITISALREWMAKIGASGSVAVHRLGKFKTAAQMIAIPCLLYWQPLYGLPTQWIGQILIVIAAILTVWSMCYYLNRAWPEIRSRADAPKQGPKQ